MPDWKKLTENLEKRGYTVKRFATADEAAAYIDSQIDGKSVGMGGSVTLQQMGLYEKLSAHNEVHWHWTQGEEVRAVATASQVYLTSANGMSETGEIINIDGLGNRVAATVYGPEVVYFVVGANKIAPDAEGAMWRARNVAAPKNTHRLNMKTPCALRSDKCYECDSPARGCNIAVTLWRKPGGVGRAEVILIEEELGY